MITPEMLDAMRDELSRVDAEMERLSDVRDALRTIVENYALGSGIAQVSPLPKAPSRFAATHLAKSYAEVKTPLGVFPNKITADIADVLQDGRPLHLNAIFERLTERGVYVAGKIPQNNISSHISRDKEHFERVGKGTYRLKMRPAAANSPTDDLDEEPEDASSRGQEDDGTNEPPQDWPRPQRPALPETEVTFAEEEFDDVPF